MTSPTMSFLSDGLYVHTGSYSAGVSMTDHSHDEARFVLQLQGMTRHEVRRKTLLVTPSTLLFIPAGEPHADCFLEHSEAFILGLKDQWLSRYHQVASLLHTPSSFHNDAAVYLALRMSREAAAPDNLTALTLEGLTLELLASIARTSAVSAETSIPRWLRQIRDLLNAQFTEELTMETLASTADVHPSHLMRAFRQHYRVSIGEYVRRLRIDYACRLLASSDLLPSQVAYAVGFHQQSHFCRAFKAQTGMTPSEFAKLSHRVIPR